MFHRRMPAPSSVILALVIIALPAATAFGQDEPHGVIRIAPGDPRINVPEFEAYEAAYASAFGRFTHQVRPIGPETISVLNLIETPQALIVDQREIDRNSLRMERFISPYFAWGQEYVVGRMTAGGYDWARVPLDGGEASRSAGIWETGGVFDSLGFSPTLASLLPMETGSRFSIPRDVPQADGSVSAQWSLFTVIGREALDLGSGLTCDCWILEDVSESGERTRYWVDRKPPFLFRRHRDIGGPRDFVSDLLAFRLL